MAETKPQGWSCTVAPGKTIRLADIPIDDFIAIAAKFSLDWGDIYYAPLHNAAAGKALYEACCRRLDVPIIGEVKAGAFLDAFNRVEDDVPYSFTDGLPDPTRGDGLMTVGSSSA